MKTAVRNIVRHRAQVDKHQEPRQRPAFESSGCVAFCVPTASQYTNGAGILLCREPRHTAIFSPRTTYCVERLVCMVASACSSKGVV